VIIPIIIRPTRRQARNHASTSWHPASAFGRLSRWERMGE